MKVVLKIWMALGVLAIMLVAADQNRDFYKILGIKRSAKEAEIKKAFKQMSKKYHPDKNRGDDDALRKF